jgi:hypothetical protein
MKTKPADKSETQPTFRKSILKWVVTVFVLLFIVGIALDLADLSVRKTVQKTTTYSFSGTIIDFDSVSNSNVTVQAGPVRAITVSQKITQGIEKAQLITNVHGDTAVIKERGCDGGLGLGLFGSCTVRLTVTVPLLTTVVAKGANTNYTLIGVAGRHQLSVENGNISLHDVIAPQLTLHDTNGNTVLTNVHSTGAITATSTDGNMTLNRSSASALILHADNGNISGTNITTAAITGLVDDGNIHLQLVDAPVRLTVTSDNGNITVRLPHNNVAYRTSVTADNGTASAKIKTDPDTTKNIIHAKSTDGNVLVSY